MELGQLLQFLDHWLLTDRGPASESLTRFVGCDAYGIESLRDDLARFTFLLGASDGEGIFSHAPPQLKRTHRSRPAPASPCTPSRQARTRQESAPDDR